MGGLEADALPNTVYKLETAPHDWLFPRMAAVVHHGGAGTTAAGFQWYPPHPDISAQAATWTVGGAVMLLPSPVRNCRINDLNHDGSIAVGWSERFDGVWLPTVCPGVKKISTPGAGSKSPSNPTMSIPSRNSGSYR